VEEAGIAYRWEGKALGGMRPSYADHMRTDEFQSAARGLSALEGRVCILCAESNPSECHRSFHRRLARRAWRVDSGAVSAIRRYG